MSLELVEPPKMKLPVYLFMSKQVNFYELKFLEDSPNIIGNDFWIHGSDTMGLKNSMTKYKR